MKTYLKTAVLLLSFINIAQSGKAQFPVLSSNPSASAVIFLDFDGHTVDNTSWNYAGPIYCGATTLSAAGITEVFNRVAEDYRPFQVNVTTDSTRYFAAPITSRTRVILTTSWEWYGSAGGVAFVGSFTWGDDTPCFVFTSLHNNSVKNISEAASHEAGHTLGLYHQALYDANCVKTSDYNNGTGTGEISWAPIMGVGYSRNLTLWNSGPNPYGCATVQNDLTVITNNNGISYRTDEYAATFAGATNIPFVSNQFTVSGIITQSTDQDMIKFTQPSNGRFQLDAIPYNVGTSNAGSNLDLQVTLFNSSQSQLNIYNPGTLLNSVIDTTLNAGTYYLRIEGKGNIYAPNYASLGSYSLTGKILNGTLPLRLLKLQGEISGDKHKLSWVIDADEQVTSQVLEVSADGISFTPVVTADAASRTYTYKPFVSTTAIYRLSVTFDNGKHYYSNMVTLRNTGTNDIPKLVTNVIGTENIRVSSPGNFDYAVFDLNGRPVAKGRLTSGINNISGAALSVGMYIIRYSNAGEQWTDKLIRH
ncbi:MAG TPA: T9SS type A sorting domain-containing protein [Chitinophagaceae bacterium]|nr:T9SS type A sorting domain-containing protein [Chitinophagaceae bacterium]HMU58072.1 T9SS type A sorting domain-containing protein [Chitinophagaceae bacterium]